MDFCCFYFPLFCIHWLMEHHLLSTDTVGNADDIWTDTMGVLPLAEMGKQLGEVADKVSDRAFLWSDVVLRRFLFACILLIINHISFIKLLA